MRVLVTGAYGQLGREILRRAPQAVGFGSAQLDITDAAAVHAAVRTGDVVLNCAAYTAVDRAEADAARAFAVNETGAANLARACADTGARLVHVSTDYVFDGAASAPYETDAPTAPRNVYGSSKLAGEHAVHAVLPAAHIVRTSWVYSGAGTDFVAVMRRKAAAGDAVRVVADQHGAPTYAGHLAAALLELAARPDAPPLLHATGAGETTWFELAHAVFAAAAAAADLVSPCTTADWPTAARRPAYSVLSTRSWADAGLTPLPHWHEALKVALSTPGPQQIS